MKQEILNWNREKDIPLDEYLQTLINDGNKIVTIIPKYKMNNPEYTRADEITIRYDTAIIITENNFDPNPLLK